MSRDANGGEERREGEGTRNSRGGVSSDAAVRRSKAEGQKETRENAGRRSGRRTANPPPPLLLHNATVFRVTQRTWEINAR